MKVNVVNRPDVSDYFTFSPDFGFVQVSLGLRHRLTGRLPRRRLHCIVRWVLHTLIPLYTHLLQSQRSAVKASQHYDDIIGQHFIP